jgi:hypothetical protein
MKSTSTIRAVIVSLQLAYDEETATTEGMDNLDNGAPT